MLLQSLSCFLGTGCHCKAPFLDLLPSSPSASLSEGPLYHPSLFPPTLEGWCILRPPFWLSFLPYALSAPIAAAPCLLWAPQHCFQLRFVCWVPDPFFQTPQHFSVGVSWVSSSTPHVQRWICSLTPSYSFLFILILIQSSITIHLGAKVKNHGVVLSSSSFTLLSLLAGPVDFTP